MMDNKEKDKNPVEENSDELSMIDEAHVQDNSAEKTQSVPWLPVIAIILSVSALAASAYINLSHNNQSQKLLSTINSLEGSLQNTRTDLANAQQRLKKNLERQQAEQLTQKKSLAKLYSNIENTGQTWSAEEIHHLLQLAIDQLSLAGNVEGALAALTIADRRVASNGDPELQVLRQQLARDIASLQQVNQPDLAGTIHRLNALSESITHLPVVHRQAAAGETSKPAKATGDNNSVWQNITQDLSGLVKIRSIDQPVVPLLPPDQEYFLRENTKALLVAARLALLQENKDAYKESLQQTKEWLIKYFNTGSHNTQWAIGELVKLAAVDPQPQLPDISGSLKQLQTITKESQR
jgi:uroporphyrin-3 C-methyltransferase